MNVAVPSSPPRLWDHLEWTVPFAAFMAFLVVGPKLPVSPAVEGVIRVGALIGIIGIFSRRVLDFQVTCWFGSLLLGVAVFVVWIAPEVLFPAWRDHWLLQNGITGWVESSFAEEARTDILAVLLRATRAIIVVPIVEELFWRGWLMRWLIDRDFQRVALGSYAGYAFLATAVLFALEHGAFWDVGLAAGLAYNWWMIRTRRLGDLILAHAVTNACLVAYVLASGRWQYL